jgi:acetyl esterase/lipase
MSPLRWFLTATQLTRTLAWSEEVRWKTGIVYEKLHTRHKTKALKLDMYRPKQEPGAPKPRLPVFLYIHGPPRTHSLGGDGWARCRGVVVSYAAAPFSRVFALVLLFLPFVCVLLVQAAAG